MPNNGRAKAKRVTFRPFQAEDYETIKAWGGRGLVAWSQGLGKTPLACQFVADYMGKRPAVVVCPASLKEHWVRQLLEHVGIRATILNGKTPPRKLPRGPNVWIINYDILGLPRDTRRTWTEVLMAIRPGAVVLDEVHAIIHRTSQRSRACYLLCQGTQHRLGLSGTPMPNRPIELWHPCHVIDRTVFPSYHYFGLRYCNGHLSFGGYDFTGHSNLKELNTIGRNEIWVRRRKEDVLDQLPPMQQTVMPFHLNTADRAEYMRAVNEFLRWLAERDEVKARRAAAAEEVTKLGYLLRLAAELKRPQVVRWVEDFLKDSDEKLLLFGVHKDTFLRPLFKHFGATAVLVNGDVAPRLRQAMFDRFNDSRDCRLFLGHVQAGGTGWSCRSSSNVFFGELPWRPGDVEQCIDRCRGIKRGTGRSVQVLFGTAADTIEDTLCGVLESKRGVIDATMDGGSTGDLQIYKLLTQALVRQGKPPPKRKRVSP
jgi:SWI/SNF-related matrix-associated actin-dependent regulator 1 of chromatin subfamily A